MSDSDGETFPRNDVSKESKETVEPEKKNRTKKKFKNKKKPDAENKKGRLVVRNIPFDATEIKLLDLFQQYGNVTEVKLLRKPDGKLVGCGFVNFENAKSAGKAMAHISGKPFLGRTMIVDWAVPKTIYNNVVGQEFRVGEMKPKQSDVDLPDSAFRSKKSFPTERNYNRSDARLFITNLPFRILEDDLRSYLNHYGPVLDLFIIRKNGRQMGNGFVTFTSTKVAANVMEKLEGREFQGRPLYFKWAQPKKDFHDSPKDTEVKEEVILNKNDNSSKLKKKKASFSTDDDNMLDTSSIKSEAESSESENEEDNHTSKKNGISADDSEEEEEKEEDDDDDDEDEDEDDEDESSESESDSQEKSRKENWKKKSSHEEEPRQSNDISEGLTVFLRNVPFDVDNNELKNFIKARFGAIYYALVCMDPATEHSRGTAFVKFKNKDSVEAILNAGDDLSLHDELMQASMALSRDDVYSKQNVKKKAGERNDNRNLYLSKEGLILAGSKAAIDVSISDMDKRLSLESVRARILKKNALMFVSTTRLVVYNLPPNYTDVRLKALFTKYSPTNAVITEARVMKDMKKFNEKATFASREFGYVNFTKHEDAIEALRTINNHPNIFSKTKRPIVLFSIENRQALATKEKRLEKSRRNNPLFSEESNKKKRFERTKTEENPSENGDGPEEKSYRGFTAVVGKTVLKSGHKVRKQAQTHAKNVKKAKKLLRQKKQMAQLLEDKQIRKQENNKTKKRKRPAEEMGNQDDQKFERFVSEHKSGDSNVSKKSKKEKINPDSGELQRKKKWFSK